MLNNRVPRRDRAAFKRRLLYHLGKGKAQAIPGQILSERCGYENKGDRMTRMMIRELIGTGVPVASSTGKSPGFFIAETPEEVRDYINQLIDRIREDAKRLRDFKRASRPILQPGQLKMIMY